MEQPHPTISEPRTPLPTGSEATVEYRLHPRIAAVWAGITAVTVALPAISGAIVLPVFGLWYLAPLALGLGALLPWLHLRYCRRYVAAFRCTRSSLGLLIERGVWWRSQTFVPRRRVQHTDVDQGPLARRLGMATLKVFTAGSEFSQIAVEGLRHAQAIELRDELIDHAEHGPS